MVTSKHTLVLLWVATVLCSCGSPVDPDDALFFSEGTPYVPAGLICGMAYQGGYGEHIGGSCQGTYDPALEYQETSRVVVAEGRRKDRKCPEGTYPEIISDHDSPSSPAYGRGSWRTCSAEGNRSSSSADPRDLPAGTVCGLAAPRSLDDEHWVIYCEGHDPSDADCPDGYEPRWIPDAFDDGVDSTTCLPDNSAPILPQANAMFFCAVRDDVGCIGDNCSFPVQYSGLICGLHARGTFNTYFSQDASVLNALESGGGRVEGIRYETSLYDYFVTTWFKPCSDADTALEGLLSTIDNLSPPMCMGKNISDGICPGDLTMVCSPGWYGVSSASKVSYTSMCWCTTEGSYQRLAVEDRNPDTGAISE